MAELFDKQYSLGEEIANSITHGVGAVASLVGLTLLIAFAAQQGDPRRIAAFAIYGGSLVLMYMCSTLYHSLPAPRAKRVFKVLDHAAIYLLIAGTYTPFMLVTLRDSLGLALLVFVWGLAFAGVTLKLFAIERMHRFSTLTYLAMGWICVFIMGDLIRALPWGGVVFLVLGGLSYTGGVLFYRRDDLPYAHSIWHVFVLGGSVCHYIAVFSYVL